MSVLDDIGRASYVSLTTYRKDGTPVATPVWHALHDGDLYVVSEAKAWKVRRIRNNPQVSLTVCDIRGRIKPGAPTATGTARLLDEAGTSAAREYVGRKYFMSRAGNFLTRVLHIRRPEGIGIAITLA